MLAVCRGLREAGYAVGGVAGTRPAAGHWSRSVSKRYHLPNPRADADAFVAGLAAIVSRGEYAALVPGVDAATLAVSEHREQLEQHVRIALPPHEIVMRCLDKPAFLEAATLAGIAPPPSETCATLDEALAAAARIGYPVVLKPTQSLRAGHMHTTQYADDERAVRDLFPSFGGTVTLQRCETGHVCSISGVVFGGELLALCASRDERMWPPRGGFTSASVTMPPPSGIAEKTEALLRDLGWQGMFQLELVEGRDGLASIDFNPRPYGSLALAIAAGANLPAILVDALLGRAPTARIVARPGVRYRWEETEVLNALVALRDGRVGDAARVAKPRRGTTHAFFRASDPAPLAARVIGVLRSRLLRR